MNQLGLAQRLKAYRISVCVVFFLNQRMGCIITDEHPWETKTTWVSLIRDDLSHVFLSQIWRAFMYWTGETGGWWHQWSVGLA